MTKKILFLDIDGVVNSKETVMAEPKGTAVGINPYLAFLVGKIVLDTGCSVVVSSSWRNSPDGMKKIEAMFPVGTVIGKTKNLSTRYHGDQLVTRGEEILHWLRDNRDEIGRDYKYVILDDDDDFYDDQPLFNTTWEKGITEDIAKAVTEYLNEE